MFFSDGYLHALVNEETDINNPLRLHQFVSTVFRSELNIAENGTGYFIRNAPKASAHHAILNAVVKVNNVVCKVGQTCLKYGDLISLQLKSEVNRIEGELISWKGSEQVAKRIEGECSLDDRQGRMMVGNMTYEHNNNTNLDDCEMIKYYRDKLGDDWTSEVESAILQPLPLTIRVLKPSTQLSNELEDLGFKMITEEDFSLQLSGDDNQTKQQLDTSIMQELIQHTWIAKGNDNSDEKKLGIFLAEARISNEILQQETTSMLPVSILSSHLKRQNFDGDVRFLDMCAAPGSKTTQLLSTLDGMSRDGRINDFTLVANEINSNRTSQMKERLHQQFGGKSLENLTLSCADGRDFIKMNDNSFDYIICDVPCSGDGTIRKSPKILNKWSLKNGAKNKSIQKQLLEVGLGLLKPTDKDKKNGGFLVYSTCSLNPMENEEVILEVLDELNNNSPGYRYELVNLSDDSSVDGSGNIILSVLPARSHGGFFVAAIRKLTKGDDALVGRPVNKKGEDSTSSNYIVKRQIGTRESKATISYCISTSTQQCHNEINEKMGRPISCGVPVLYESKCTKHILVQGFASSQEQFRFQHIRLSHSEFIDCYHKCSNYREIMLHMNLDEGRLVVVEITIAAASPTEADDQSIRLPARVLQVNKEEEKGTVVVAIEARPQVYSRALSFINSYW